MLHHLSIGVRDLPRSIAFYDRVLAPLGYVRVWAREDAAGYGEPGGEDRLALYGDETVSSPSEGFHLALAAGSRGAVDAFHAAAMTAGGRDNGMPGLRPHYGPTYYAAFVIDPDGW